MSGWIGFDFDGTLATHGSGGHQDLGDPVESMVRLVKTYLTAGYEVRIVTARPVWDRQQIAALRTWCLKHIGTILPLTNQKDFNMILLFDDRAVTVALDEGRILGLPTQPHTEAVQILLRHVAEEK